VSEKDGRIWLKSADGRAVRLTTSGRDSEPWITPDRSKVLFVRADPADMFRTSVYSVDIATGKESLLLGVPVRYEGRENDYIGGPRIDRDGRTLFVISKESVTEGALLAVDLASGIARYIAPTHSYDIIRCGEHSDDLLLYQRKISILRNIYYVYWLYSPRGEDLGIAGPDLMDTQTLFDEPCAATPGAVPEGAAPRLPSSARLGPPSNAIPPQVPADAMARRLRVYVKPEYPPEMQRSSGGQVVRLALRVSPAGDVTSVTLISGDPRLALPALAAARLWKYQPWLVAGVPTEVVTTAEVRFQPEN
jgi:TonB family protein